MAGSLGRQNGRGAGLGIAGLAVAALTVAACSARSSLPAGQEAGEGTGGTTSSGDCSDRIRPVSCRAEPPECGPGEFPASDGFCWTGECLDCIDGCQSNDECVVVDACGCYYHEGCSWAETRFRAARLDPCISSPGRPCAAACSESVCSSLSCPWCSADGAECSDGRCVPVVDHMCY